MSPDLINMLASSSEIANFGGYLGTATSWLVWLFMAMIGIFALYFGARWVVGQKSMAPAVIVAIIAFVVAYGLSTLGVYGWLATGIYIVLFIVVIKLVYCRGPKHGWWDAFLIWVIFFGLSFFIGFIVSLLLSGLIGALEASIAVNPVLTYAVLVIVLAVCIYIGYLVALKITTKPTTREY